VCVCMCVCIQSTQLVAAKVSRIKYSQLCAAVGARIALCIHTCRIARVACTAANGLCNCCKDKMVALTVTVTTAIYSQDNQFICMFGVSRHGFVVQRQSDDSSEEFKIASFVAMVDGCSVIGVPYSSTTGPFL